MKDSEKYIQENEDRIRQLLELYFDGETSLEEEEMLKDFFTGNDIPEDLRYAVPMFSFFREEKIKSDELEDLFTGQGNDKHSFVIETKKINRTRRNVYKLAAALSACAAVILLYFAVFNINPVEEKTVYCYINGVPVTDPEAAMEYTMQAFEYLSDPVDKTIAPLESLAQLQPALEKFKTVQQITLMFNDLIE